MFVCFLCSDVTFVCFVCSEVTTFVCSDVTFVCSDVTSVTFVCSDVTFVCSDVTAFAFEFGCLFACLVVCMVGWWFGWFVGWLVGWLMCRDYVRISYVICSCKPSSAKVSDLGCNLCERCFLNVDSLSSEGFYILIFSM